jgi:hypothetical protein
MFNYFFKLRSTVCLTNKDLGEEVVKRHALVALPPRDTVHIAEEAGWASGPV